MCVCVIVIVFVSFVFEFEFGAVGMYEDDVELLLEAATFATLKHRLQVRKGAARAAYIEHPMRVARSLRRDGGVRDADVLAAALLHDTVEDTDARPEEIAAAFGARIAGIVAEVTDDKALGKVARKRLQIEHVRTASREARLVKLADKLDNLAGMFESLPAGWSREIVQGYFAWAKAVVDSGLRGICPPLEEKIDALWDRPISAPHVDGGCPFVALPDRSLEFVEAYYARLEASEKALTSP